MAGHLASSDACFALGASLLELGSLANTVCELRPGWSVRLVWTPLMVLSNASASLLVIWYAWTFHDHGTDARQVTQERDHGPEERAEEIQDAEHLRQDS